MRDAIRDDFNGEAFRIADSLLARGSVAYHSGHFEGLGDPAAIVFALSSSMDFGPKVQRAIARGVSVYQGGYRP